MQSYWAWHRPENSSITDRVRSSTRTFKAIVTTCRYLKSDSITDSNLDRQVLLRFLLAIFLFTEGNDENYIDPLCKSVYFRHLFSLLFCLRKEINMRATARPQMISDRK